MVSGAVTQAEYAAVTDTALAVRTAPEGDVGIVPAELTGFGRVLVVGVDPEDGRGFAPLYIHITPEMFDALIPTDQDPRLVMDSPDDESAA